MITVSLESRQDVLYIQDKWNNRKYRVRMDECGKLRLVELVKA